METTSEAADPTMAPNSPEANLGEGLPEVTATPPAEQAAEPVTPAAVAPKAEAPKPAAPARPAPARGMITMSELDFHKRVAREAEHIIKKKLGMDSAAAAKLLAEAEESGPKADAKVVAERDSLKKQLTDAHELIEQLKVKLRKNKIRSRNRAVEADLQNEALAAGVERQHSAFALEQYRQDVQQRVNRGEEPQQPGLFFAELQKAQPYLFKAFAPRSVPVAPAAPTPARPSTSAPAARGVGAAPPPAAAPSAPAGPDIDKMDERTFADYARTKHGFRPY